MSIFKFPPIGIETKLGKEEQPYLTSLAEDVELSQEKYTHIYAAYARAGNRTRTVA